ncbi:uncharacterized protein LOC121371552 [Gigantopelta aegis]|uniref:uncharacterized protein LOC121371552 n=1 Tax=Gigantopelta aegis TaxID=1735272 RepID=UPI001B88936E|nr:uncharacterized protein LOC121371552 [Gigantopelta aegis]
MKIPLPGTILRATTNKPLPEISPDDIETIIENVQQETLKQRKNKLLSQFDHVAFQRAGNREDFKSPLVGIKLKRLCNFRTPSICPKLINLSFSQPSSPRTPALGTRKTIVAATPCMAPNNTERDGFVISTPMVLNPLECLHKSGNSGYFTSIDILDVLDDEAQDVTSVESHIRRYSELELTDTTIVDYLLDIGDDTSLNSLETFVDSQALVDDEPPVRRIITRRVFRHCKPLSEQEKLSLREIKKKKAKERARERKNIFKKPEKGIVRKSKRSKKPVKYI